MERPKRGAAVVFGIVEHAILGAVACEVVVGKFIADGGQGEFARDAVAGEDEGAGRQAERLGEFEVGEVGGEEGFDAAVDGAAVIGEEALLLGVRFEESAGNVGDGGGGEIGGDGEAVGLEQEVDVAGAVGKSGSGKAEGREWVNLGHAAPPFEGVEQTSAGRRGLVLPDPRDWIVVFPGGRVNARR